MHHKTVLDNGVKVLSERLPHVRSVSLGIWIGVGSRDERPEESGISHFIEHMIFKGTHRRSSLEIARELDAVGGFSNAFTSKENTCIHGRVLDRHFPRLVDILSDLFLQSVFDREEMDREKQVVLQEISMVEDTPEEYVHLLHGRHCWPDHPLGMSVLGSDESVGTFDQGLLLDFYQRYYTPERIIIAAAGNIQHDDLVAAFRPLFGDLPTGTRIGDDRKPSLHPGTFCYEKELEQVHLCLGGRAPELTSGDRLAGALLNTLLGGNMSSRLFQEIRERRGLAYAVYSFLSAYLDTGLLGVYLGTDPRWVNEALAVVKQETARILEGDLSEDEMEMMREHLIGGILLGAESTDNRMMRLAKNEYVYNRYVSYDELIENLGKVRVEDVIRVARDCFQSGTVSLVALGPLEEGDLDPEVLRFS
ncbi:MAG: insulinase family protein [Deltaproteobacteria bacterium]|nr:insulinase family protein [Deltaproteobacteria bacterium]